MSDYEQFGYSRNVELEFACREHGVFREVITGFRMADTPPDLWSMCPVRIPIEHATMQHFAEALRCNRRSPQRIGAIDHDPGDEDRR